MRAVRSREGTACRSRKDPAGRLLAARLTSRGLDDQGVELLVADHKAQPIARQLQPPYLQPMLGAFLMKPK